MKKWEILVASFYFSATFALERSEFSSFCVSDLGVEFGFLAGKNR